MDSRVDPPGVLGIESGDAKILRNVGVHLPEDVLTTLVVAHDLLEVSRPGAVAHANCAVIPGARRRYTAQSLQLGAPTPQLVLSHDRGSRDGGALRCPAAGVVPLCGTLAVGGFCYHIETGALEPIC